MTTTSPERKKGDCQPSPEEQIRRLRQAVDLFAEWSDCLQRARDPDTLISCLCGMLSTTGGYSHVDIVLGEPTAASAPHSWTFVPGAFSLPLRHQGRRLGTLTVAHPNATDLPSDDELHMLGTLADDLAFGIDSLAAERERAAALEQVDLLSRAIEQSPFAVVITDANGRIEYCN